MSLVERLVLGCMRLSTELDRDEGAAVALLELALARGVRAFDTARAYGLDEADVGHNERLLRRAMDRARLDRSDVRVFTKCGMTRPGGAWVPDGRQRRILDDAAASADALGGPADVLFLHAPDPATPLTTSVRALRAAMDRGFARAVGLSNVRRAELDRAREVTSIAAIQIPLGAYDDVAARSGLVRHALDLGVDVLAYAPFGGPENARRIGRDRALTAVARAIGVSPYRVLLAYLERVEPRLRLLVGPTREQTLEDCLSQLGALDEPLAALDARFEGLASLRVGEQPSSAPDDARDIVLAMGIAGAGKSSFAERWMRERESRGDAPRRLNRDTAGGTLKGIAKRLGEALASGARAVILDNTYVGRAERADVVRIARRHGARVRCVHFEISVDDALHNVALRMIDRHRGLVDPSAWNAAAKTDPGLVRPTSVYRMGRDLEAPTDDEGFVSIERIPFVRRHREGHAGLAVSVDARASSVRAALAETESDVPLLVFGFRPDGAAPTWEDDVARRARELCGERAFDIALCLHGGGPPVCYCRPPLPGLVLAFAARRGVDPRRITFVVSSAADKTMAKRLGARTID